MKWYKIIASICSFFGLKKIILNREKTRPYLERYYLISTRWLGKLIPSLSYRLVLHKTLESDEAGLHDHPWSWSSRILSGGYWEATPHGKFWRSPKDGWRKRTANDYHRLELDPNTTEEVWSLFIMGPRVKEWGFLSKDGHWVYYEDYLDNNDVHY